VDVGRDGDDDAPRGARRELLSAWILSIGSEITVGETRDTNAGELARHLAEAGVEVRRLTAIPDDLITISAELRAALDEADVVISTGGLGPTPDDLTREAIADLCGETPAIDPDLERWLRALWKRREMPFPEVNLKQAWLIRSATAIPNPNGTAPGWWVERPDGRLIVALPGPPREMRPMWHDWVMPRLVAAGLGRRTVTSILRLTGIGESQVADRLGSLLARDANPLVATYARAEAVDIRISSTDRDAGRAQALVDTAEAQVLALIRDHVWARGATTWADAIGSELVRLGWTLAVVEIGTGLAMGRLLDDPPWLRFLEALPLEGHEGANVEGFADRVRATGGAEVGLAVRARPRDGDTAVSVAVASPLGIHRERRLVFLQGELGRSRAAIAAAAVLLDRLRSAAQVAEPGAAGGIAHLSGRDGDGAEGDRASAAAGDQAGGAAGGPEPRPVEVPR
jgi:nicotinamide-nucleotide amidase